MRGRSCALALLYILERGIRQGTKWTVVVVDVGAYLVYLEMGCVPKVPPGQTRTGFPRIRAVGLSPSYQTKFQASEESAL